MGGMPILHCLDRGDVIDSAAHNHVRFVKCADNG
jgi:hypothetical protein